MLSVGCIPKAELSRFSSQSDMEEGEWADGHQAISERTVEKSQHCDDQNRENSGF